MQVDQLSSYLSELMHTANTASATETAEISQKDASFVSTTDTSLFKSVLQNYVDTKTDDRTPLEVAQDAYAEFLSLAADAVSGSSGSKEESILNQDSDDDLTALSDLIDRMSSILNEAEKE